MKSASNIGMAKVVSASGNIQTGPGAILGLVVSASTSGTIALYDDAATGTSAPLLATMSLTAGQYIPLGFGFGNGLNVVLTGTATITAVLA
jgi:hypothetical protein